MKDKAVILLIIVISLQIVYRYWNENRKWYAIQWISNTTPRIGGGVRGGVRGKYTLRQAKKEVNQFNAEDSRRSYKVVLYR